MKLLPLYCALLGAVFVMMSLPAAQAESMNTDLDLPDSDDVELLHSSNHTVMSDSSGVHSVTNATGVSRELSPEERRRRIRLLNRRKWRQKMLSERVAGVSHENGGKRLDNVVMHTPVEEHSLGDPALPTAGVDDATMHG